MHLTEEKMLARSAGSRLVPGGTWSEMSTHSFTCRYTHAMLRVSDETRERVQRLAREEFGGISANDAIQRLLEEHWEAAALAAVERYRAENPPGWAAYVAEAEDLSAADAPVADEWLTR